MNKISINNYIYNQYQYSYFLFLKKFKLNLLFKSFIIIF